MLSFALLGQVALHNDGQPLNQLRSQKESALLLYLAHTGQTHQREFVADMLWESSSTKQGLSNLRTTLSRLRKQTGDALDVTRKTVALSPESVLRVDSINLLNGLAGFDQIDSMEHAQALYNLLESYGGEFLTDFSLPDAPQFDAWVTTTREHIRHQVVTAYDKLGQFALSNNDVNFGINIARRWLEADALDEQAHILLIRLLIDAGNVREAISHYDACTNLLRTELSIEPPEELTSLIHRTRSAQQSGVFSPSAAVRNYLSPHPITLDHIVQEIHSRLEQPQCRLLTIVRDERVDYARLTASIVDSQKLEKARYSDGVWDVKLDEIDPRDEDLAEAIAVEIATAFELRLSGVQKPVTQLVDHLRDKTMLLVLDQFEHVIDGADLVREIIEKCEQVQMLVCATEALQIQGEQTISLYEQNGAMPPSKNTTGSTTEIQDAQRILHKVAARLEPLPDQKLFGVETAKEAVQTVLWNNDRPWLVALDGIGGIGKTTLANALVHDTVAEMADENSRYADIGWISAKQEEFRPAAGIADTGRAALNAESMIDGLLGQLLDRPPLSAPSDEKLALLTARLKERPHLIVVDNLESVADYEALVPLMRQLANPSKFLITLAAVASELFGHFCYSLTELGEADALAFVQHEATLRNIARLREAMPEQLQSIYNTVGGNPLALKLVIGQVSFLSLPQVLANLTEARGKKIDQLYVYIYWQAWEMLDDAGRQLFLSMPIVPDGNFTDLEMASGLDVDDLQEALAHLINLSLVQVGGELEEPSYRLHRLTETFLMNEVVKWQAPA